VPVIIADPAPTVVRVPLLLIVATLVLLDCHAVDDVTFCVAEFVIDANAVKFWVAPLGNDTEVGVIEIDSADALATTPLSEPVI
jgi:hypothetical protein